MYVEIIKRSDCNKVFLLLQKILLGEWVYFIDVTVIDNWKIEKNMSINQKSNKTKISIF